MGFIVYLAIFIGIVVVMLFIRKKLIENFVFNKIVVFFNVVISIILAIIGIFSFETMIMIDKSPISIGGLTAFIITILHTYAIRTNRIFGWYDYGTDDVDNWDGTYEITIEETNYGYDSRYNGTARPVYNKVGAGTVIVALIISVVCDVIAVIYVSKIFWFVIPVYLIINNVVAIRKRNKH